MFLLVIVLSLLACVREATSACVQGQAYWASNTSVWPYYNNATLCGASWRDLLRVQCVKMALPVNAPWVLVFHQYASAALNLASLGASDIINYSSTVATINATLLYVSDSLERACEANISTWWSQEQVPLYQALATLRLFNAGASGPGACGVPATLTPQSPFYSVITPDLILIPYDSQPNAPSDGNATGIPTSVTVVTYSLLDDEYRYRAFLIATSVIATVVCVILACVIGLYVNRKRTFHLAQKKRKEDDAGGGAQSVVYGASGSSESIESLL